MNQIIGNPIPYKVGRKVYFVSYVSMGEWQMFNELLQMGNNRSVLELIYYSLHRGNSAVGRRNIRWLVRRHTKALLALIDLICEISLPKLKIKDEVGVESKDAERNMKTVYRLLSRMHGWTPSQISEMSPAQVYSYLMGGPDATGIVKMSDLQYQRFMGTN